MAALGGGGARRAKKERSSHLVGQPILAANSGCGVPSAPFSAGAFVPYIRQLHAGGDPRSSGVRESSIR
jgi:hypothetical protein